VASGVLAVALLSWSTPAAATARKGDLTFAREPGVELVPPPAGKAAIVFLRPGGAWRGVRSPIRLDGEPLTVLVGKTASIHVTEPGKHTLQALGEQVGYLVLDLAPDRIHVVLVTPRMGKWNPSFALEEIDDEDADRLPRWLAQVYLVEPKQSVAGRAEADAAFEETASAGANPQAAPAATGPNPVPSGETPKAASEKPAAAPRSLDPPGRKAGDYLVYAPERGLTLTSPPGDRALLVFLRTSGAWGGIHAPVFDDEDFVTFLTGSTAFPYLAEPGRHRFLVIGETADFLTADLEGGKIYFALVAPYPGKWRPRFRLTPVVPGTVDWNRLAGWLLQVHAVEPTDAARAWAAGAKESVRREWDERLPGWEAKPEPEKARLRREDGVAGFDPGR
jgi:hypothetical protein